MDLTFKYITDISGRRKKCPKDPSLVSLFMTPTDEFDLDYYVYAACTKPDYSSPELINVDKSTYDSVKEFFMLTEKQELGENLLSNTQEIFALIHSISDIVKVENTTIGDMLKLTDGGDSN